MSAPVYGCFYKAAFYWLFKVAGPIEERYFLQMLDGITPLSNLQFICYQAFHSTICIPIGVHAMKAGQTAW